MRYFAKDDYNIALTGQFIMGISYSVVLEAPIRFSLNSFKFPMKKPIFFQWYHKDGFILKRDFS